MIRKVMQKRGFTLVELLAVIVILGIALTIAVPATTSYIEDYKEAAFFTNVQLIVNEIKQKETINEEEKEKTIVYNNKNNQDRFQNIDSINVIGYWEEETSKRKYVVVAQSDSDLGKAIVTDDFYTLSKDESDKWVAAQDETEYRELADNILEIINNEWSVADGE